MNDVEYKESVKQQFEETYHFGKDLIELEKVEYLRIWAINNISDLKFDSSNYWFYFKDDVLFKRSHHLAAEMTVFFQKEYTEIFTMGANGLFGGFMSDDKDLVEQYYLLPIEQYVDYWGPSYYSIRIIRALLIEDYNSALNLIIEFRKSIEKRKKGYFHYTTVFEGIINNNEEMINWGILELTKSKRFRETSASQKIFCYDALELAKMASYFGFEITVNHPAFPLPLAKFVPLENYEVKPYYKSKEAFEEWAAFKLSEKNKKDSFWKKIF